jgi:spermidine/putrescine transport system permease protein
LSGPAADRMEVEAGEPAVRGPAGAGRNRRGRRLATLGLVSAPVGYLAVLFLVPVLMVALYSFGGISGLVHTDVDYFTVDKWRDFLTSHVYTGLFWKSVWLSTGVSITCVLLAYPVAYFLALIAGRRKYTLLLLILAPFLTSYLLRVLAWRVLLNPQGVIQSFLRNARVLGPDQNVAWLYNSRFAVYLVLAYVWVPFVALPIFVALESLDLRLLEASNDLGGTRWRTFWNVTFPLSVPGVVAAFVFVFIPTLGEYITPLLVGGKGGYLFGNAVQSQFLQGFNWQFGSAMAMFLIVVVAVLIAIFGRYLNARTVAQ